MQVHVCDGGCVLLSDLNLNTQSLCPRRSLTKWNYNGTLNSDGSLPCPIASRVTRDNHHGASMTADWVDEAAMISSHFDTIWRMLSGLVHIANADTHLESTSLENGTRPNLAVARHRCLVSGSWGSSTMWLLFNWRPLSFPRPPEASPVPHRRIDCPSCTFPEHWNSKATSSRYSGSSNLIKHHISLVSGYHVWNSAALLPSSHCLHPSPWFTCTAGL